MVSFEVPTSTLLKQHEASNPKQSVWVSANAGAGKTHVLASRVMRLLLSGAPPAKILCLTFTKAAAANMATRIFDTLAKWTRLTDDELCQELVAIGAPSPNGAQLIEARTLFARAVETPGGLKISTIHAFCERLLHLFPFESQTPARFEIADEERQTELLRRACQAALADASSGTGELGSALRRIAMECEPEKFDVLIKEAMAQRAALRDRSPDEAAQALRRALALAVGRDVAAIERDMATNGLFPEEWRAIADALDHGLATDKKCAEKLRQAFVNFERLPTGGSIDAFLRSYQSVFLTEEGEARKILVTKDCSKNNPSVEDVLRREQARLIELFEERRRAATLERTHALLVIANAVLKRYELKKAARGVLDFDDLIDKTLTLLDEADARWVLFKLDAGLEHILIDEAQDTNEAQWKILERLTSEFAAGDGQNVGLRTFFSVGDKKQSIFSFQGAAPAMFEDMREKFKANFVTGEQPIADVRLDLSFRSAPGVLLAIDRVFEHGNHKSGLIVGNDEWMRHKALKENLPSLVEIWPLAEADTKDEPGEWTLPAELACAQDPAAITALHIADKISSLIGPGSLDVVHDSATLAPRPVRPGDILILVRRRAEFFDAMIRALRERNIPASGADRLELAGHIAVKDLIAAGRASLCPHDDLTLACLLKSPLVGLDDGDLLVLAPCRKASLLEALEASSDERHKGAAAKLARWRMRASAGPFSFYASLLGLDRGRQAIEARLGAEACDGIDEFLRLALAFEEVSAPSLSLFLDSLEGLEHAIKRDMESGEDLVRVMTVHAAKGLEAKIVFLPDTCGVPTGRHDGQIFALRGDPSGQPVIAWSSKKDFDCEAVAAARQKMRDKDLEEERRLLYVALSRAEERLYIAGFHGEKKPDESCWWNMIDTALGPETGMEEVPAFWDSNERVRRLAFRAQPDLPVAVCPGGVAAHQIILPCWLTAAPPGKVESGRRQKITPSAALSFASGASPVRAGPARRMALQRGDLIHLLLQYLPSLPARQRYDAALALLAARAPQFEACAHERLVAEVLDVIALPELAALFGSGSRPEVSVTGSIKLKGRKIDVDGRVDRIGENDREVLAADYKTGAPCEAAAIPLAYHMQMALYRAALAPLWPGKTLRMLIIWTEGPSVVSLPDALLDAELASLAAS